jgi:hypothetical protein
VNSIRVSIAVLEALVEGNHVGHRRNVNAFLASLATIWFSMAMAWAEDTKAPAAGVPAPVVQPAGPVVDAPVSFEHMFPGPGVPGPVMGPTAALHIPGGYNHCGPRCWSDPSTIGAGNLKTECFFVFSSSRAFFGEPCLPPPPGVESASRHHFRFRDRH